MPIKRSILGVRFDLVGHEEAADRVLGWVQSRRRGYVTFANPHCVELCRRDPAMRSATDAAAMTLPDGVGIIWVARMMGLTNRGRVSGPEFMLHLCDVGRARGCRHFFFGGAPGVPERLAEKLMDKLPGLRVAGTFSPPYRSMTDAEIEQLAHRVRESRPDVFWVGLGAPKQEKWMQRFHSLLEVPVMIGVGAAFDFHSGNVGWAPTMMRKAGLEWAFRLASDPGRMWRRDVDSFRFLWNAMLENRNHR